MTSDETKSKIVKKFSRKTNGGLMTLLSPFVVCKTRKTLFLHIAKTGGSAIHSMLKSSGLDDNGVLSKKRGFYEEKLAYFTDVVDHWDEYYKFTMIRNKYAQLVSNWNYDKKNLKLRVPYTKPIKHFREFIKTIVKDDEDCYGCWIDQYDLTMLDGKPVFDLIGNYDSFDADLKTAMDRMGVKKYDGKSRVNQVPYKKKLHFSEYYDQECEEIVYNKFKDEIDHFGFKLR